MDAIGQWAYDWLVPEPLPDGESADVCTAAD
jgi:hypothetical protein